MQPKTHVVDGVTFVATPYRAGTFVREDVFWRQFTITCQGYIEYPEDDRVFGTWWTPHILELGLSFSGVDRTVCQEWTSLGPI